ncbi:MAG: hypothetical protein IJV15_02745 [Lachnospiraceae bacterium]|nr:hypothetical protein [Lachnospiraceae bacterium]
MLEIFNDYKRIKHYDKNLKYKKMYSYTNEKWVYYHYHVEVLFDLTTMHRLYLPWEFLEHHTEEEIRNYFGEEKYSILAKKTAWIEELSDYKIKKNK